MVINLLLYRLLHSQFCKLWGFYCFDFRHFSVAFLTVDFCSFIDYKNTVNARVVRGDKWSLLQQGDVGRPSVVQYCSRRLNAQARRTLARMLDV